jgi:hypothetical protein
LILLRCQAFARNKSFLGLRNHIGSRREEPFHIRCPRKKEKRQQKSLLLVATIRKKRMTVYYGKYLAAVNAPDFTPDSVIPYEMKLYIDQKRGSLIWGRDVFRVTGKATPQPWTTTYFTGVISRNYITLTEIGNIYRGKICRRGKQIRLIFSDIVNNASFKVTLHRQKECVTQKNQKGK